jgi:hypothetical protein
MLRFILALALALCAAQAHAQEQRKAKSFAEATRGFTRIEGFIPLYWDTETGRMLLEVARTNEEFLYQISLPTGLGSNPVGLDRGQLGPALLVRFERAGPKLLLVQSNYRFRALSEDAEERRAVEESFARSVIWGFRIEAAEGSRLLVDATDFFLRDAHGVADRLREARQGNFRTDADRSAFYMPRTKGFPKNTEVETTLTLVTDGETGPLVGEVVPSPRAVTLRQHHSLVELPPAGFKPRRLDPRVGVFAVDFYDYATPIGEPLVKHWIVRHRLEKKNPAAAVSEPVKPLVYYVDRGTPEPIRSALIEGASWWNQAFEAAGFRNAFRVEVLPEGVDPMDVRYNVINWVHRSTRGWAYGSSVIDPRTGEVVKGVVTLDSQRARQDFLLASGLVPQYAARGAAPGGRARACDFALLPDIDYLLGERQPTTGADDAAGTNKVAQRTEATDTSDATALALARIRQLSAHEVGHTLGLAHNFAASTYGRASVMDYPAPLVRVRDNRLDFSEAYAVGIGDYDKFAVRYAYAQLPAGANEEAELERIIAEGVGRGMLFLSDEDARPAGAAHPLANLWDNGADPIAGLRHELAVRRIALSQFGLGNLPRGAALSGLEAKLLPLYLHHRYQLMAAAKSIGGVFYTYAVRAEAGPHPARVREIVPPARQREALEAVLATLGVEELMIPQRVLELIPPRAFGQDFGPAELFPRRTGPVFDALGAASIAADLALTELLQHERAARLIEFHARDSANPDFREVVAALVAATWSDTAPRDGYEAAVRRVVQSLTVTRLMDLAGNAEAAPQVRAVATDALRGLVERTRLPGTGGGNEGAHRRAITEEIERFLARPSEPRRRTTPLPRPPGDPIGSPR